MTDGTVVEKVIDSKTLILLQRVGALIITIGTPLFIGFLIGLDGSVNAVETRVSNIETRLSTVGPIREQQLDDIAERLDAQANTQVQILQAIARLEAKIQ